MIRSRHQQGFTLLEMLATVALIAIAMGGVTVFFSSNNPLEQLKKQIDQFIVFSEHATDFTMVNNETWGLVITPPHWRKLNEGQDPLEMGWEFRWQKLNSKITNGQLGWQNLENVPAIELPYGIALNITVEGELWTWEKKPEIIEPLFVFYSTGEKTNFEIELVIDNEWIEPQHIIVDDWGRVVWQEREEARKAIEEELGEEVDF